MHFNKLIFFVGFATSNFLFCNPLLIDSVKKNDLEIAYVALRIYKTDPNITDENGASLLEIALKNNNLEMLQLLCHFGAKLEHETNKSILINAIIDDSLQLAKFFRLFAQIKTRQITNTAPVSRPYPKSKL